MSKQALEDFAKSEKERMDAERAQAIKAPFADLHWVRSLTFLVPYGVGEGTAIKAKGGFPYLESLKIGETLLHLHPVIPTNNEYQGRNRKQFIVSKVGIDSKPFDEKLAWTVNPQSPTYRDLLDILPKAPINIRVIRTGQSKSDTRYTIVQAP